MRNRDHARAVECGPEPERCNLCDAGTRCGPHAEVAWVRSNVRAFRNQRFAVWRCPSCRSLHARDALVLPHFYEAYPFHRQRLDWKLRAAYAVRLRRLRRAGLERRHRVLDYGCGSGCFVAYLAQRGYQATGYDAHHAPFASARALQSRYDAVLAQDVVEHVQDPRALLETLGKLALPGALVDVGTPDAAAIDLRRPGDHVHVLHQPYHLHLFSKPALLAAARALGWKVERSFAGHYSNTRVPFVNMRFGLHYARCFDDCVDLAFDPVRLHPRLFSPRALALGLLGSLRPPASDVAVVFRVP